MELSFSRKAQHAIGAYPNARQMASLRNGIMAVYFIGGSLDGQQWTIPVVTLNKTLRIGNEEYKLHVMRESLVWQLRYPFYVHQSLH